MRYEFDQPYSPEQRKIFKYYNGVEEVFGDPLAIDRRLRQELGGDPNPILKDYSAKEPELWVPAAGKVVDAIRIALPMAPWNAKDGTGATELDCKNALARFMEYLEKNAGKVESLPTGSLPSGSTQPAGRSATKNM